MVLFCHLTGGFEFIFSLYILFIHVKKRLGFGESSKPTEASNPEVWNNFSLEGLAKCTIKGCEKQKKEKHSDDSESEDIRQPTKWINPYSDTYAAHVIMRLLHHILDHEKEEGNPRGKNKITKRAPKKSKARTEKRSVILVGHSLGGKVALNCYHYFPQSFSGIIFVNSALFSDTAAIPAFVPHLFQQLGESFFKILPSLIPPKLAYYDFDSMEQQQIINHQKIFSDSQWIHSLKLWGSYHFSDTSIPSPETILHTVFIPGTPSIF